MARANRRGDVPIETTEPPRPVIDGRTMIETPSGPVPAADLSAGDLVLTFDDGARRLRAVERHPAADMGRMVVVPSGLIGNEDDLLLAPEQTVLVETDLAEWLTGNPFAAIPAKALLAAQGVRRARAARARQVVTLSLTEEQAVMASVGAVIVTPRHLGFPCLIEAQVGRYALLDATYVPHVVASLDDGGWDAAAAAASYAAMA